MPWGMSKLAGLPRIRSLNLARLLIGAVFLFNVQCALAFLAFPGRYAPAFELPGEIGAAMIRGMGVLFLMWNVPYAVALWNPMRYRLALWEALVMQAIGVLGESIIYMTLSPDHEIARASIARFITFDAVGLMALLAALLVSRVYPPSSTASTS